MPQKLLWIHGWGMSSRVWEEAAALLPGYEHHYFTYTECDTIEDFRQALSAQLSGRKVMEETEGAKEIEPRRNIVGDSEQTEQTEHIRSREAVVDTWTLIGWSMGGMLGLEHWLRREARVAIEAVVVVSSTLLFVDMDRTKGWPARMVERLQKQLLEKPEETLRQFALSMLSPSEKSHAGQWLENIGPTDFTSRGLVAGLTYLLQTNLTGLWEAYHKEKSAASLPSPRLLWIHGEEDPICPPGAVPALSKDQMVLFQNTGHAPMLTQKKLFYEHLRRFLHGDQ